MASRRVWGAETVISNITFQTSLCSPAKGDTRISLTAATADQALLCKSVLRSSVVRFHRERQITSTVW